MAVVKGKKLRWNITRHIQIVCDEIIDEHMNIPESAHYQSAKDKLCSHYGISEIQLWFLAFGIWYRLDGNEEPCPFKQLAEFLGVNVLTIAGHSSDFGKLSEKKLISYDEESFSYEVSSDLIQAVVQNRALATDSISNPNYVDFSVKFREKLLKNFYQDDYDLKGLLKIESQFKQLPIIKNCMTRITDKEARLLFYAASSFHTLGFIADLSTILSSLYDRGDRVSIVRSLTNKTHILQKLSLLDLSSGENINDAELQLTIEGKQLFFGDDFLLYEPKFDKKQFIGADSIKEKKLFYSSEVKRDIDTLQKALQPKKLHEIRDRLEQQNLPVGINILLYGKPGTGKTETVFQLAKATGRDIVKVDISEIKSCWFGESEKQVKELFLNYKRCCEQALAKQDGKLPILLINEADAVLSKRRETLSLSTSQTENAIQNILLEEMENQQGIIIATTNLAGNFDAAFERRFLFKIKFENPTMEAKKAIWQSKLEWLEEDKAEAFARRYDFSGGEIDNISRKVAMSEVITGMRPTLTEIEDMCRVEKLAAAEEHVRNIGFVA